ncbi:MAG: hypothetical protein JNN11_05120 [Candidatus Doudnabacteria bacterium]|nr:hypothetical protein [Candidatus Doudnabacteria bacterium]
MQNKYIDYYKNNPEGYWFKRKLYGYGWVPVRWQGWVTISVWLLLVIVFSLTLDESSPPREVVFTFVMPMVFLTGLLIRICYKKGEKPRWQWGLNEKEK